MKITSIQKKTVLPALVLVVSLVSFAFLIKARNPLAFLLPLPIGWSVGVLGYYSEKTLIPKIGAWFNRDGWK
ncbi:hypothetical protein SAMN05216409_1329 [Pseudomonas lutea]|uniref:Uncharacterized protein n=1 Tax=Pseudomonas lutea TaxID=243924 RepID=A0A9X8MHW4_9PSED|nr:hypothetical protein SAMN05216409_1329 [Pseudomonas lutea]